jgi:predicted nucleotidyltransferase
MDIILSIQNILVLYPEIKIAYLYGSAAKNRLRSDSDVDIAVSAQRPLTIDERLNIITSLSKGLDREIDLVDLSTTHGLLLYEILTKGKLVLCKDTAFKAELMKEVVYFAEDFLPQIQDFLDRKVKRFIGD